MRTTKLLFKSLQTTTLYFCGISLLSAGELWVDHSAPSNGDGSAEAPFQTITAAVKASMEGDTVTVKEGTYHEWVPLKSGTAESPFTLRAAPGERVVVSSFDPISDWTALGDGRYTTVVDQPVRDLYVGYRAQPLSIWPNKETTWRAIDTVSQDTGSIVDRNAIESSPLSELAQEISNAYVFAYFRKGNYHNNLPLSAFEPSTGTLTVQDANKLKALKPNDSYIICNHPALVDRPGEWAYEILDGNQTRITFLPHSIEDLKRTQTRGRNSTVISTSQSGNRHVIIDGIETAGSRGPGIQITHSEFVKLRNCIVHNAQQTGVIVNESKHIELTNNIVFANNTGISVYGSEHVTIEANEVAANQMDGIILSGSRSGRRNPEIPWPTSNIVIRKNYIHHHLDLGHPDGIQTYFGVKDLLIEDNLLLFNGQGIMMSDTEQGILRGNIIYGTAAMLVIFGHNSTNDWTLQNNTLGLGYWGSCNFSGIDYRVFDNVFYANDLSVPETYTGDRNLLSSGSLTASRFITPKPHWTKHKSIASFTATTGQDAHSQYASPEFANAPAQQISVDSSNLANTADSVHVLKKGATAAFKVGDIIEISGDGIARKVTAVDELKLGFTPALPRTPFRDTLIWNWKQNTDFQLDLSYAPTSPALTMSESKSAIGASIDIAALQRGDFDGDGVRDLPTLDAQLREEAWPTINDPIIPAAGI